MSKLKKLRTILNSMGSALIAYSGGADSSFLLHIASNTLPKEKILAVTANSATYPKEELLLSRLMAKSFGVKHLIINSQELKNSRFILNPSNRCYYCKKELFGKLKPLAKKYGLQYVIDASNFSDKDDFRPGDKAKKELGIRSPLQEARITKGEIRSFSKRLGLKTWDKPSLACLASRIPYGTKITPVILRKVHRAENYLKNALHLSQVRVRHYNGLCRIEVIKADIPKIIKKRNQVVDNFKKMGYNYIVLDLEGFRTGSMNLALLRR